jgi:hypothetical protein
MSETKKMKPDCPNPVRWRIEYEAKEMKVFNKFIHIAIFPFLVRDYRSIKFWVLHLRCLTIYCPCQMVDFYLSFL